MASLVSGAESASRWGAYVERSVVGSVHAAELPFAAPGGGASLSGSGMTAPGIGAVALRGKAMATDSPDESRINRAEKRRRLITVAPVSPPKDFSAGSILERSSMILRSTIEPGLSMAFAPSSDLGGREIEIATSFFPKADKVSPAVPSYLAELVTNDMPDVLATAYAPAEPDYEKSSPFAALLDLDENDGRFIPPAGEGDHAWMTQPLPASVFEEREQACLANAVYFEARGESTKGQAAVAQVVLNRVRNPAYPDTICKVVYQNEHLRNRCQFSFACDGIPDRIASPAHHRKAGEVAMAVTAGKIFIPEVGSSTHYYAQYVSPRWARTMERMTKIGLHIFYRTYGGGWI
jgi:spore germination cell wall hydrolase CwlJ-like protein